ncbi:MAG: MBL fold metallo-hydrolase [Rhizobiaceae bacterium]
MRKLMFLLAVLLVATAAQAQQAEDETPIPSTCIAMANALPNVIYANLTPGALGAGISAPQVKITFAGHSTYVIETPEGVTIATDFNGWAGADVTPRVVTMNKAHSTHYTDYPDPAIEYVLRGWNPEGGPARHRVKIDDVYVRNVTTDIRAFDAMEPDGNSIFIFEVAGLCIGHLGHLHHRLEDRHFAQIGRLDIVMVPVDGGLTLSHEGMTEITRRLQSSIVLPMHRRGMAIERFIAMMGDGFAADFRSGRSFTVSLATLPRQPTILVLSGI